MVPLVANSKKKTKESFHNLVKECLGPNILSTVRVRIFLRRAREYIEAYYLLEVKGKEATPVNLDQLKMVRKSHTDVNDISSQWLSEVMKDVASSTRN